MTTNEERRDAAARLRMLDASEWSCYGQEFDAIMDACECNFGQCWQDMELCERLADLIEPEPVCIANVTITAEQIEKIKADVLKVLEQPERTCKYIWDANRHVWFCSECGGLKPCSDSVNYCCYCGARVVGNIDERER